MIFGYFRGPLTHFGGSGAHSGGPGVHSGGPGAHSGGPERHFEDFWDSSDFGGRTGAKGDTHFDANFNKFSTLGSVVFCCFFECSFFRFFVILGARRLHFGVNFEVILRVPEL